MMEEKSKYILAASIGAIGGGIIVAVTTRTVPKMMSAMMRNMMLQMNACGANPTEM